MSTCQYPELAQLGETCACEDCGPAGVTRPCADGLVCEFTGIGDGGMSTCQYPELAQLGETCACEDCGPAGVTRPCADGLVCFNECSVTGCDGGMSTCQYPELGSWHPARLGAWHPARLGSSNQVLCPFKPPAIGSMICREGEICVNHQCQPSLGACKGCNCLSAADCPLEGEICIHHRCIQPLGASSPVLCPFKPPAIGSVICRDGEICVDHECQYPELGSWHPARLGSSNNREACSLAPPAIGTWLCAEGETCVNHKCVQPSLGASNDCKCGSDADCPSGQTCHIEIFYYLH